MLFVLASLNDKFDSTDALFNDRITSLNQAASVMYSNATQSLQVTMQAACCVISSTTTVLEM